MKNQTQQKYTLRTGKKSRLSDCMRIWWKKEKVDASKKKKKKKMEKSDEGAGLGCASLTSYKNDDDNDVCKVLKNYTNNTW